MAKIWKKTRRKNSSMVMILTLRFELNWEHILRMRQVIWITFTADRSYLKTIQKWPKIYCKWLRWLCCTLEILRNFLKSFFALKYQQKTFSSFSGSNFSFTERLFTKVWSKSVDRGLIKSSFYALLTSMTKELYTVLASYMHLNPSPWRGFS